MFVTELDRLAARDTDLRHIGGTVDRGESGYEDDDETDAPEYAHPGDGVRAPMKYLSHRPTSYFSLSFQLSKIVTVFSRMIAKSSFVPKHLVRLPANACTEPEFRS